MSNPGKKSKKPWLIIVIVVVIFGGVGMLGCLAAIAVPAFIKYVKSSKAAEAPAVTRNLAEDIKMHYEQTCEWPMSVPKHATLADCCGGKKCTPTSLSIRHWQAAGLSPPSDPTYFVYQGEQVDESTYVVRGISDFQCGGEMHTVTVEITGTSDADGCTATASPSITFNEFE